MIFNGLIYIVLIIIMCPLADYWMLGLDIIVIARFGYQWILPTTVNTVLEIERVLMEGGLCNVLPKYQLVEYTL